MIKLCKNLFYKPKYGNDADSLMMKRLFSTVTTILVCLAAISFSAYAFFSYSVTSGTNTIKASRFSASVTIQNNDGIVNQGNIQSCRLEPGQHTVIITADSNTTGTGFFIIEAGGAKYYTQQLGKDISAPNQERLEISFILDVQAATTVTFESRWGTSSYHGATSAEDTFYIKNTDPLQEIVVAPTQSIADNDEENNSEETSSTETTPTEITPTETTPTETTPTETTPTETTPTETTPTETTPITDSDETIHIVQPGESLASIANKYGFSHLELAEYNKLDNPQIIQPNQEIKIPPTSQAETSPESNDATDSPGESTDITE